MAVFVPSCATQELDVVPFAEAVIPAADCGYDTAAWLYAPTTFLPYRYVLGKRCQNPLICIGINPSTAAPGDLDNTLKSVERIAHGNGYDSFIMFNVYAQRATDPDHMEEELNKALHEENMKAFDYALSLDADRSPAVWAAWGTIVEKRPYLKDCLCDMVAEGDRCGAAWFHAGKPSFKGHPHHPLYLKKNSPLQPFDMLAYLKGF